MKFPFLGYIRGDLIAPQNGRFPSDFKLQNVVFPGDLKATNQWRLQNDNAMIHIGVFCRYFFFIHFSNEILT